MSYPHLALVRPCGTIRDTPDDRDFKKTFTQSELDHVLARSAKVDLRGYVRMVYDQLDLGSCTANAVCAAYALDLVRQPGYKWFDPSRLFLYFNGHLERKEQLFAVSYLSGGQLYETFTWVQNWEEEGLSIRDCLKALNRFGLCKEHEWPYNTSAVHQIPSSVCYTAGKGNICRYEHLEQNMCHLKACLKEECPFVFGIKVYPNFYDMKHPYVMPRPKKYHTEKYGLHAVMAVGYDDFKEQVIVLNSWGRDWGDGGYFYMPYDIITDGTICFDFWKVTSACVSGQCPQPVKLLN